MNRRGFLGALIAASAGAAATALPVAQADPQPVSAPVSEKRRRMGHFEWFLPREWTLDHIQACIDKVEGMDARYVIVAMELGSHEDRRRFFGLMETARRYTGDLVPLFVNERLGERGLRFELERRVV